jgi:hypothetical protein
MWNHDHVVIEGGQPEFAIDSDELQKTINELTKDLTTSSPGQETLDDFGEDEAAYVILNRYASKVNNCEPSQW